MPMSQFWKATSSIKEKKMQNSSGASTQPCLVPLAISKSPNTSLSSMTCPCMPLWKDCMILTNFSGQPIFLSTCQSPSLFTESKALVRSTKTMYRSRFCSLHFSCICLAAKIMSDYALYKCTHSLTHLG